MANIKKQVIKKQLNPPWSNSTTLACSAIEKVAQTIFIKPFGFDESQQNEHMTMGM